MRGVLHRKGAADTVQEQKWDSLKADTSASHSQKDTRKKLIAELIKTSILVLSAFAAIVLGTIAWFSSNTKVDSGGIMISHQYDTIRLATKGYRQNAEERLLKLAGEKLPDGTPYPNADNPTHYVTEGGEIALRLSSQEVAVSPGANGEITFYIIPNRDGPQTVTLHLSLAGYQEVKAEDGKITGSEINDIVLSSLLSGHILLFESHENGLYSEWLPTDSVSTGGANYQITVSNQNAVKDKPLEIKLYWVWPLRYQNMAKDFGNVLDSFIAAQASQENLHLISETNNYRYSQIFLTKSVDLTSADPESRSDAYNQADEYIGKKADYLYVTIGTNPAN